MKKKKKVSHKTNKKVGVQRAVINLPDIKLSLSPWEEFLSSPDAEVVPQHHWNCYIKNRQPYTFGQLILVPWYKKLWHYLTATLKKN